MLLLVNIKPTRKNPTVRAKVVQGNNKQIKLKKMKKFKVRMTHVEERLINGQKKKWLTCEMSVSSLIEAKRALGKELFSVNVRGYLSNNKPTSEERKKPVFKGIMESMNEIRETPQIGYLLTLGNNGCTIMCESIERISNDIYEITLTNDYHGIGNGQQTTYISEWIDSNYPISNDVTILCKMTVGFSEEECIKICKANNTSNKIDKKDIKSVEWKRIHEELKTLGISFNYKKEKEGQYDINIFDENYYNMIGAYFTNRPWVTGQEVTDIIKLDNISGKDMIEMDRVKKIIDGWFETNSNEVKKHGNKMDITRLGYLKNIMISLYTDVKIQSRVKPFIKKYGDVKFFELIFEVVIKTLEENEKTKVSSNYFNKKTYELLSKSIVVEILESEMVLV